MPRTPWGLHGGDLITNTAAVTGSWTTLLILEATTFTSWTAKNITVAGTIGDAVFPAGALIHGGFTAVRLSTGSVMAFDGAPTSA
jgi:hypothetical protein